MASRDELNARRELAKKLHRAATAKVSRHRKKGVELAGTKRDPRHSDPKHVNRLTAKQLDAHISRLESFVSRETQYVHGAGKKSILSGQLYKRFESLKKQVNEKRASSYEAPVKGPKDNPYTGTKLNDIALPSFGQNDKGGYATVDERIGQKPKHPVTGNPSSRAPHLPIITTNAGIPNEKQLKKLIKNLEHELSSDHGEKIIARDQKSMRKFLRDMTKVDKKNEQLKTLRKDFWDLTPGQFAFLWNYTDFSNAASMDYEIAKDFLHDKKGFSEKSESFNTQIRYMQQIVGDVKNLPF